MTHEEEALKIKLDLFLQSYEEQHERQAVIERKAQLFVGLSGGVFVLFASNLENFVKLTQHTTLDIIFLVAIMLLIIGSIFSYLTLYLQNYLTIVNVERERKNYDEPAFNFLVRKANDVLTATSHNKEINDSKSALLNIAALTTTIGILALMVAAGGILL